MRAKEQAAGEAARGVAFFDMGEGSSRTDPFGPNQRIRSLVNKGEVFRQLVMNPVFSELMGHLLGDDFLFSSISINITGKGGKPQPLHADGGYAPAETPYPVAANAIWMLTDFTEENGATRVLPGSHRAMAWPEPDATPEGMVQATGPAGTLLVFDGRIWHGTGASRVDEPRYGMLCYSCRPWVRQQENFTLTVAPEALEACSQELRDRLGFRVWRTLGRAFGGAHHGAIVERPTSYETEVRP